MSAGIEIANATKAFDGAPVLRGIDLTIEAGTVTVVLGPSGSGKSTLLRAINHLEPLDEGPVVVGGELIGVRVHRGRLKALSERRILEQRARIGFVFQSFNLFPHLTILENVTEAPLAHGIPPAAARARAEALLERVGLAAKAAAYPRQLSGGQQQRVAIYRADVLAFAVREQNAWEFDGDVDALAGLTVATDRGTNQEKILLEWQRQLHARGKTLDLKYYPDSNAVFLALRSGAIDAYFTPGPRVSYQEARTANTANPIRNAGTYSGAGATVKGLIAATSTKGSGLAEPIAAALNYLIENGYYATVLEAYHLTNEAVATSDVNPPGLPLSDE